MSVDADACRITRPLASATVKHYAEAFTIELGRCFRMVQLPGVGHPMHGIEPVAWHGPIVMNSQAELQQAFSELRQGTFIT